MDGGVSVFPNGILKSGWQCFEVDGSVYFGISVFWYFGVSVFWCFGVLVFWCFGSAILVFQYFSVSVFWVLVFRCSESCGLRCDTGTRAGAWILGSRSFGCYPQHINGTTASAPTPHKQQYDVLTPPHSVRFYTHCRGAALQSAEQQCVSVSNRRVECAKQQHPNTARVHSKPWYGTATRQHGTRSLTLASN